MKEAMNGLRNLLATIVPFLPTRFLAISDIVEIAIGLSNNWNVWGNSDMKNQLCRINTDAKFIEIWTSVDARFRAIIVTLEDHVMLRVEYDNICFGDRFYPSSEVDAFEGIYEEELGCWNIVHTLYECISDGYACMYIHPSEQNYIKTKKFMKKFLSKIYYNHFDLKAIRDCDGEEAFEVICGDFYKKSFKWLHNKGLSYTFCPSEKDEDGVYTWGTTLINLLMDGWSFYRKNRQPEAYVDFNCFGCPYEEVGWVLVKPTDDNYELIDGEPWLKVE